MKKLKSILSIIVIVFVLVLASCNSDPESNLSDLEKYNNRISESLGSVNSINFRASITDGTVKVYDLNRNVVIQSVTDDGLCSGTNNSTIQQLSSGFQLSTSTEYIDFVDVEVKSLFNLNLKAEVIGTYTIDGGTLSGSISTDKSKDFFGSELPTVSGNITYSIVLVDSKLSTFSCSYKTISNRDVEISATYNY